MNPLETRHSRRWSAALGITLAIAATACGGGSGASTSTPDGSAPGGSANGSAPVSPEEFGLSLAELAVRVEDTEGLIAKCMTEAGFDYVALDFVTIKAAMDSDETAAGVSSEDYLKQYGKGITTQFDKPLVVFGAGPENNAYLEALPAADQVAFRRALWGDTPDRNHARAVEDEDFSETGGCTRSAAEQTFTPSEVSGSYLNPTDKLIEQDPRMVTALAEWSDCMRAEGHEYSRPDAVDDDLRERLDAITQGQDPATLTGPALDALHELQGEELALALVAFTCEEERIEPVKAQIELELLGPQP